MKAFSFLVLTFLFAQSLMALPARIPQTIQFLDWPYISSLSTTALSVESLIVKNASQVCGSLAHVGRISQVTLNFQTSEVVTINPNGIAGQGTLENPLLIFGYPKVTGTAQVYCK